MKYEYLKGSEKDFEGAPEWAMQVYKNKYCNSNIWFTEHSHPSGRWISICGSAKGTTPDEGINVDNNVLIAERRPITEPAWDGEGLPPIGCVCEYRGNDTSWGEVKIIGHDEGKVVFKPSGEDYYGITPSHKAEFIPIRSPEDVARDEALNAMSDASIELDTYDPLIERIYGAIAAGKIPGITLSGK